jgi:phage terminase small subunit
MSKIQYTRNFISDYLFNLEEFNQEYFFELNKKEIFEKNGEVGWIDHQLLVLLTTQAQLYIDSMKDLKESGTIITFNNGVTVGPNPHVSIADKALSRIIQLLKELQLTPITRGIRTEKDSRSEYLVKFLQGPLSQLQCPT